MKLFCSNSISNLEIIKLKSQRKILAISLFAVSEKRSLFVNSLFSLIADCLASRKQCKSSVSKMRIAAGQFSATRQPNCSSVINRSKSTTAGFKFFINESNVSEFITTDCVSTLISERLNIKLLSAAAELKVILKLIPKKKSINCSILLPAADDFGSGHTVPIINSFFVSFII